MGLGSYRMAWLLLKKLRAVMVRLDLHRLDDSAELDEADLSGTQDSVTGCQLVRKGLIVVAVGLLGNAEGRIRMRHVPNASSPAWEDLSVTAWNPAAAARCIRTAEWPRRLGACRQSDFVSPFHLKCAVPPAEAHIQAST